MKSSIARLLSVQGESNPEKLKSLYKSVLDIAMPAAAEGALLSVISAIDTMMVGVLGASAVAAVGLTGQPRMIMLILAQSLCIGTTALIARRKGAGNHESARQCLEQSMLIVTILGLLITLVGIFLAEPLMLFSGANADTLAMSTTYFRIIALGFLPNCWQLCICAAFRAIGKTRITLVTQLIANVINVCFNFLLIGGNFGFPAWGVAGAAAATSIGTLIAAIVSFRFAMYPGHYFVYHPFRKVKFDRDTLSGLWRIGGASIAESLFLRIGFLMTQKIVAGIGTIAFAAYQVVSQVTSLSFTLGDGVSAAGVAMVGQSLGAGDKKRAMLYVHVSRKVGYAVSILLMIFIASTSRFLPRLFLNDPEVIRAANLGFWVVILGMIPQNGRVIYAGCLRGAGDVRFVAACSLIGVTILRPLLTLLFCFPLDRMFPALHLADTGSWWSFVLDAFVRNALLSYRIHKGQWMNISFK